MKVGMTPVEPGTGIFPSLTPTAIPPPATPVPDTYWDRIKNERRPAGLIQLTYREWLD